MPLLPHCCPLLILVFEIVYDCMVLIFAVVFARSGSAFQVQHAMIISNIHFELRKRSSEKISAARMRADLNNIDAMFNCLMQRRLKKDNRVCGTIPCVV